MIQSGSAVSSMTAAKAKTTTPMGSPGTLGCSRKGLSQRNARNTDDTRPMGTLNEEYSH